MKKQNLILCVLIPWLMEAKGQYEVLNNSMNFLPNRSDTADMRVFQFSASVSGLVPRDETNEAQKNRLGDRKSTNSLFSASMEMVLFVPWWRRDRMVEPNFGVSVEAYPSVGYMSSRVSVGFSIRPNVTLGFSAGSSYRQVANGGDFVTRRGRQFDNHPLYGGYIQAVDKNVLMLFALTFEQSDPIVRAHVSSRIGATLGFEGFFKTLQVDFTREEFSGPGIGFSFEPIKQLRLQFLRVVPDQDVRNEQARLGNKLTSGFLVSARVYVN